VRRLPAVVFCGLVVFFASGFCACTSGSAQFFGSR